MIKEIKNNFNLFLIASLTLGLAPFNPPHIIGKLQWIVGGEAFSGENAMQIKDIGDLIMHGTPWLLLLFSGILKLNDLRKK